MKKFAKGCLIAALSMLAIGIVILMISFFLGGASLLSYVRNEARNEVRSEVVPADRSGSSYVVHPEFSTVYPTHSGHHENRQAAASSDISNLDIEIGAGSCIITESSDEYFHISSKEAAEFQYYTKDRTLYIKGFDKVPLKAHHNRSNELRLEIPKGFSFEDIELELGAGRIEADSLSASREISIEVGAGEMIADELSANTLDMEVGAGSAEIKDAFVKNCDMEVGLGSMIYSGTITQNLSAECGMGNMELYLDDTYENHNYELECAMGNITLDHKSYAGIAGTNQIRNNADSTYTLECAMGSITILFEEKGGRQNGLSAE